MSDVLSLLAAKAKLCDDQHDFRAYLRYIRQHGIDGATLSGFAGACVVRNVVDCGNQRFEFANGESEQFPAFLCEAFGDDGETFTDLAAWPLDRPRHVMTMFGRCGLLGACEAMNPATYFLGNLLDMHRTPLGWLKAGCRGAVVVTPHIAARIFLDLPGKVAAQDEEHGRELEEMRHSILPKDQILVPAKRGGLAA